MGDDGFGDIESVDQVFPCGEVEVENCLMFFGFLRLDWRVRFVVVVFGLVFLFAG